MRFSPYKYGKRKVRGRAAIIALAGVAGIITYSLVSLPTAGTAAGTGSAEIASKLGLAPTPDTGASPDATLATVPNKTVGPSSSSSILRAKQNLTTTSTGSDYGAKPSTGASLSDTSSAGSSPVDSSRSPYTWPFSWDSIWNIPIASTATYAPAGITSAGSYEDSSEADYDSVSPASPAVTLGDAQLASGSIAAVSVHGDPSMTANGTLNGCSAFLGTDNKTVYQGQTIELTPGGNPTFGGALDDTWPPVDIESTGIGGCHGGSGLSGLGGTLTLADLTQASPITHALKVALDGYLNYSIANGGFRWPAANADEGYSSNTSGNYYGGSNPNVQEGSLLALPRSINPSSFSNPTVAKIARAMQDYGAYIVDTTATGSYDFSTLITNYNASSQLATDLCISATPCRYPSSNEEIVSSQLDTLFEDLQVVTNNTASTPGGGAIGTSRCAPYAPQFADGSGMPPTVAVISC